jgi:hypothetical protein
MPETMRRTKGSLAVCALFMLLGGCVHQRAVAPAANSTTTPAPAPPATTPSANAPAVEPPPQSDASAASDAAKPSTVPPNDLASPPAAPSKPSEAAPTPSRQGAPLAAAVSSGKPGAPMPVAKNLPPASSKVSPAAREPGSVAPAAEAAPLTQTAQPAAALDLAALEQRLRDTRAIGVFTKLSLKNQVDDLLGHFKSFHRGQTPPTLTQLRQMFELLLIKVVTVLQDGDPALAAAVSTSREALWSVLSDPQKFALI